MAITVIQLAAALRLGDGVTAPAEPINGILTRLKGVAESFIDKTAPSCPSAIRDEAVVRMAGYGYDSPRAGQGMSYADAWRNSGATSLVSRWTVRRLGDAGAG